jgi:hypothetical protein
VSQQLDFWGMRQSRIWGDPVSRSAESTLPVAAQSYLVPWFEALAIATNFRTENTITSGCLAHVLDDFGNVCGHNFASWWLTTGFQHLGEAITDVQISYPAKRGGRGAHVASFVISLDLSPASTQQQLTFLVEQLAQLQTGVLSSSPLLWPSFHSALTIQRLCLYLKVLRAVIDLPQDAQHKILTVGQALDLVPKKKVRTYDLVGERSEKRDAIVHLTYDYFQKGRALVINAARGNFPCVVMPREFVKTRRKRAKLTAAQYAKWET